MWKYEIESEVLGYGNNGTGLNLQIPAPKACRDIYRHDLTEVSKDFFHRTIIFEIHMPVIFVYN